MPIYTFTTKAIVAFDVEAKSKRSARVAAKTGIARLREGLDAGKFVMGFTSGYIRAEPKSHVKLADTYTPKETE